MDLKLIKKIQELRKLGKSYGEIAKELLITKSNACYYSKLDLTEYIQKQEEKKKFINDVCNLGNKCSNIHQILSILGKPKTNEYYNQIKRILENNNIKMQNSFDYKNVQDVFTNKKKNIDEYLILGSTITISKLRQRLIKEGIKEYKCEKCGLSEWNGQPIPLELHHINGNRQDNRVENLQILCPNCHAQTNNYCGKKLKKEKPKQERKSKIIPLNQLIEDFKNYKTFVAVGEKNGVSDKAVIKWLKKYHLPTHAADLKIYINNLTNC